VPDDFLVEACARPKGVRGSSGISEDIRCPLLLLRFDTAASSGCIGLLAGNGSGLITTAIDATAGCDIKPRLAASVRISISLSLCWILCATPFEGVRSKPSVHRSPLL